MLMREATEITFEAIIMNWIDSNSKIKHYNTNFTKYGKFYQYNMQYGLE